MRYFLGAICSPIFRNGVLLFALSFAALRKRMPLPSGLRFYAHDDYCKAKEVLNVFAHFGFCFMHSIANGKRSKKNRQHLSAVLFIINYNFLGFPHRLIGSKNKIQSNQYKRNTEPLPG
jgi:hypothetical protein